jgi:hypothetical protein
MCSLALRALKTGSALKTISIDDAQTISINDAPRSTDCTRIKAADGSIEKIGTLTNPVSVAMP